MKVLNPTVFQRSMLLSTTAVNADPAWSPSTNYTTGQRVTYDDNIYENIQSGSHSNLRPDLHPATWLLISASNQVAMFDNTISIGTTALETLTVVLSPGRIDSIALINFEADLYWLTIRDGPGGPIVYEANSGANGAVITDWYDYFFIPALATKRTQLIIQDLPSIANPHITLTLTGATGSLVQIGEFIFGSLVSLGTTQYGVTSGIVDYSRKETDEFGNTSFIKRPFSKRMEAQFFLSNNNLNFVQNILYNLRAKPVVWIGSDNVNFQEALIVYGFYKDFRTDITYPEHSLVNIEIEGLI